MGDNIFNYTAVLYALGWAIAHSLWQMGSLWLVYQLFFGLHKNQKPALRYGAAILLTTGGFTWFIVSFFQQFRQYQLFNRYLEQLPIGDTDLNSVGLFETSSRWIDLNTIFSLVEKYVPYLSAAYLIVLILLLVRLVNAYAYTQSLRYQGLLPAGETLDHLLNRLKKQVSYVSKVKIYLSEIIDVPATIGFLKPVILLPVALVNQLTPEQVESIILHELAHIRRQDYLLNMVIAIMETVLFFNPFVHLLTQSLKKERELFCDDFVVSIQQSPQNYAAALLSLEKMRRSQELILAVAATGHDGVLLNRIKRILNVKSSGIQYKEKIIALIFITALLSTLAWLNPDPSEKKISVKVEGNSAERKPGPMDPQEVRTIAELINRETPKIVPDKKTDVKKNTNSVTRAIPAPVEKPGKADIELMPPAGLSAFTITEAFPETPETEVLQPAPFQSPKQVHIAEGSNAFENFRFSYNGQLNYSTTADSLLQAELLARKGNLTQKEFELFFQRIREMQESGFHFSPWFLQKMTALYKNEWNNSRNIRRPARKIPEREKEDPKSVFSIAEGSGWSLSQNAPVISFGEGNNDAEKYIQLYPMLAPAITTTPVDIQAKPRTEIRTTVKAAPMMRKKVKVDYDHPEDPTGSEYSETTARAAKIASAHTYRDLAITYAPTSRQDYSRKRSADSVQTSDVTYSTNGTSPRRYTYTTKTTNKAKAVNKQTTKTKKDQQSLIIIIDTDTRSINIEIEGDDEND